MDPTSCPVCHALTLDLDAHTAYHLAVAAADVIVLPTLDTAPIPDVPTTEQPAPTVVVLD